MEKFLLYTILTVGLIWGIVTQPDGILLLTYKICYSVPFWAYPLILSYDLWFTLTKRNSKQVGNYYKSISQDIIVGILLAMFIIALLFFSGIGYSNTSIDIGAFGASFVILSMVKLFKVSK